MSVELPCKVHSNTKVFKIGIDPCDTVGALKVDFTKTGKRTMKGIINDGVNSVKRFYLNNFKDGYKQDAIDLLLGNYRPNIIDPSPFQPRPGQETLEISLIKGFVLLIMTFSASLIVSPYTWPFHPSKSENIQVINKPVETTKPGFLSLFSKPMKPDVPVDQTIDPYLDKLGYHLLLSVAITSGIMLYVAYKVVKKGSKIGEKLVIHPQLLPESLKQQT